MKLKLKSGERLIITSNDEISVSNEDGKIIVQALAKIPLTTNASMTKIPSSALHDTILDYMKNENRMCNSDEIQSHVQSIFDVSPNTVAWALVELQNSTHKRSRNPDDNGPLKRVSEEGENPRRYVLR